MRDLTVGDRLDQYELTDVLSRSGMASLFKAIDTESGRTVALKVPHIEYESDVVFFERFRREEEIGRRLNHSNIVKVLEPREKSRMYLAMEYVDGRPLSSLLREKGSLPTGEALDIARQVCEALVCLHEHGVVHRDIKPENIQLTAGGQVKILDFGIALLKSARRLTWTKLSTVSGTPDYMAPEQIRGRRGDARTDVYALGTLLYEMLTGKLPYDGTNAVALLRAKTEEEPRPPSWHVPEFDPSLESIILKAVARNPRDRYPNAAELLADLLDPSAVRPRDPQANRLLRSGRSSIPYRMMIPIVVAATVAGLAVLVWLSAPRPVEPRQVRANVVRSR